ncbi:uncharacterized protein LOC116301788 [Actinia tenebrosa]|uniref:Uncharacterized protein LOC116301788 n=1 Tax=Actinia tenebrosa TaxID=6105 RepID=A0A6P8IJ69_ACTTE|nr:uncharacterized protein LOC116301788 [Actinia tenebrosa]
MKAEETFYPPKSSYKEKQTKIHRVIFYSVHHLLVCVASLPTVFFVYHLYGLPEHETWKWMSSSDGSTASSPVFIASDYEVSTVKGIAVNNSINNTQNIQQCNAPLIHNQSSNECFAPCNWTTMSPLTYKTYYGLMAVGLWFAVFATIFIMFTWSRIQSLRKFPHVVRFYIVICCILLSCCKMLPLRIGLNKVFCGEAKQWSHVGQSSLTITIQGASSHYFTLALCFWSMCFITNTYLVVVKGNRLLFERPILVHIIQSLLCWVLPAIIVASCIYSKYPNPAYKMFFVDFMTAGPTGDVLTYLSVTLPMQITLSISLCLLWSVTWCIRRSRLDHTRNAIRPDKETQSMLRIERQFTSMKVMILLVVGVVLSITTTQEYRLEELVYMAKKYFDCLQYSKDCQEPNLLTPLYAIIILVPGFLCIIFFFLLFMNKDCREIWVSCFQKIARISNITKPRSDTTKSRCSSTLTFLNDRQLSDVTFRRNNSMLRTKLRTSSTPNIMTVALEKPSPLELQKRTYLSPLALENNRPRSSSTPLRFMLGDEDTGSEQDLARVTSLPGTATMGYQQTPSYFNIEIKIISDAKTSAGVEEYKPKDSDGSGQGSEILQGLGLIPRCVPELDQRNCKTSDNFVYPIDETMNHKKFLGVCSTKL